MRWAARAAARRKMSPCGARSAVFGVLLAVVGCQAATPLTFPLNEDLRFQPIIATLERMLSDTIALMQKSEDRSTFCKGAQNGYDRVIVQVGPEANEKNTAWVLKMVQTEIAHLCSSGTLKPEYLAQHANILKHTLEAYTSAVEHETQKQRFLARAADDAAVPSSATGFAALPVPPIVEPSPPVVATPRQHVVVVQRPFAPQQTPPLFVAKALPPLEPLALQPSIGQPPVVAQLVAPPVSQPVVVEDPEAKIIQQLREENARLKAALPKQPVVMQVGGVQPGIVVVPLPVAKPAFRPVVAAKPPTPPVSQPVVQQMAKTNPTTVAKPAATKPVFTPVPVVPQKASMPPPELTAADIAQDAETAAAKQTQMVSQAADDELAAAFAAAGETPPIPPAASNQPLDAGELAAKAEQAKWATEAVKAQGRAVKAAREAQEAAAKADIAASSVKAARARRSAEEAPQTSSSPLATGKAPSTVRSEHVQVQVDTQKQQKQLLAKAEKQKQLRAKAQEEARLQALQREQAQAEAQVNMWEQKQAQIQALLHPPAPQDRARSRVEAQERLWATQQDQSQRRAKLRAQQQMAAQNFKVLQSQQVARQQGQQLENQQIPERAQTLLRPQLAPLSAQPPQVVRRQVRQQVAQQTQQWAQQMEQRKAQQLAKQQAEQQALQQAQQQAQLQAQQQAEMQARQQAQWQAQQHAQLQARQQAQLQAQQQAEHEAQINAQSQAQQAAEQTPTIFSEADQQAQMALHAQQMLQHAQQMQQEFQQQQAQQAAQQQVQSAAQEQAFAAGSGLGTWPAPSDGATTASPELPAPRPAHKPYIDYDHWMAAQNGQQLPQQQAWQPRVETNPQMQQPSVNMFAEPLVLQLAQQEANGKKAHEAKKLARRNLLEWTHDEQNRDRNIA